MVPGAGDHNTSHTLRRDLLVLIGNVIGLLIYAIVRSETPMRRRDRGEPAAPAPASPLEQCGGCGKPLGPGFEFCPYCGKALKRVCPACGAGVDPGSIRQG